MNIREMAKWKFRVSLLLTLVLSTISMVHSASGTSIKSQENGYKNFQTKFVNTGIKELDKLFDLIESAYLSASDDGILTQVDVSSGVKIAEAQISVLDTKINDVNIKISNILKLLSDTTISPSTKTSYTTALASWRSALLSYESQRNKLTEAKNYFISAQSEINSAAAIFLARKKATPTKSPISNSKSSQTPTKSAGSIQGTICNQPGLTKTSNKVKYACLLTNRKYVWVSLDNSTPASSNSSAKPSPSKTISQADTLASAGCKAFPSAIVRLQNASGSNFNSAFVSAQEASFNISQAARLDGRYGILSNAQFIIIQYAQAVGWGGRGYTGDINTVRTAVATFNSGCNSNLVLR